MTVTPDVPRPNGYRLRDFVACVAVILMGASILYVLQLELTWTATRNAVIVFATALAMLLGAYGLGSLADRFAPRIPALIRPRRSHPAVLLALQLLALIVVLREPFVIDAVRLLEASPTVVRTVPLEIFLPGT